eukprot:ctg_1134.g465
MVRRTGRGRQSAPQHRLHHEALQQVGRDVLWVHQHRVHLIDASDGIMLAFSFRCSWRGAGSRRNIPCRSPIDVPPDRIHRTRPLVTAAKRPNSLLIPNLYGHLDAAPSSPQPASAASIPSSSPSAALLRVAMIGSGYVGLVSGACFASFANCTVTCVDSDADKIAKLHAGQLPIFEAGLDAVVRDNVAAERLHFSTDLPSAVRNADVVFIAVGTPSRRDWTQFARARLHGHREQIDGAGGHGAPRARAGVHDRAARCRVRCGVQSGVSASGLRRARFHDTGALGDRGAASTPGHPDSPRRRWGHRRHGPRGGRDARIVCPAGTTAWRAGAGDQRGGGRNDQIRRQRLSGHQAGVRQRDGRPVRGRARRRLGGGPGDGTGCPHWHAVPAGGARVWRLVPAERHARPGSHRAGAVASVAPGGDGHRGQRGAQAACRPAHRLGGAGRRSRHDPGVWQTHRRARAHLQGAHRRRSRLAGGVYRAGVAGARSAGVRIRSAGPTGGCARPAGRLHRAGVQCAGSGARCRRAGGVDRVAGVCRGVHADGLAGVAGADAAGGAVRRAQPVVARGDATQRVYLSLHRATDGYTDRRAGINKAVVNDGDGVSPRTTASDPSPNSTLCP